MAKKPNKAAAPVVSLLGNIVAETIKGGFVYTSDADRASLNAEHIQVNATMKNEAGSIATRASDAGIAFVQSQGATPASPEASGGFTAAGSTETPSAPKFKVFAAVTLPPVKRGGRKASEYPFDSLPVGGGFFVPATAEMDNPAKSLASTVSSASARYSKEIPGEFTERTVKDESGANVKKKFPKRTYERKFEIRKLEDGGVVSDEYKGMAGALIARVK